MPLFSGGGDGVKIVQGWLAQRREDWRPYQAALNLYDVMLNPSKQPRRAQYNPYQVHSPETLAALEWSQFVSNWPKVSSRKIVSILARSDPKIRIATADTDDEMLRGEHLALACRDWLHVFDRQDQQAGLGLGWLWRLYAHATELGKVVIRPRVRQVSQGVGEIEAPIIDPYSFYHDFTTGYPRCYAQEREMSYWECQNELLLMGYEMPARIEEGVKDKADARVAVVEFWAEERYPGESRLRVYRSLLIESGTGTARVSEAAYNGDGPVLESRFQRAPFVISVMRPGARDERFASPAIRGTQVDAAGSPVGRHAAPWFAPAVDSLRQWESLHSVMMDAAALSSRPPIDVSYRGGAVMPKVNIAPGGINLSDTNSPVQIKAIDIGSKPFVAEPTLAALQGELASIMSPHLLNPEVAAGQSNIAFLNEIHHAKTDLVPIVRCATNAIEGTLQEIADQLANTGLVMDAERTIVGDGGRPRLLLGKYGKKDDMPKRFRISVDLAPELPEDMMLMLQQYELSQRSGALDPITSRSQILHIENPLEVQAKVDRWRVHDHPSQQQLRIARDMRQQLAAANVRLLRAQRDGNPIAVATARLEVAALEGDMAALEPSLLNSGSPRQKAGTGIAPAQQASDQRGYEGQWMQQATGAQGPAEPQSRIAAERPEEAV